MEKISKNQKLFSIGEVSQLCNISRRALRYYEGLGIISPDYIGENGYRYYSEDTMTKIPIINYLKLMNYSLDEIQNMLKVRDVSTLINIFTESLDNCKKEIEDIEKRYIVTRDWRTMLIEASGVLSTLPKTVSVKFLEEEEFIYMDYEFDNNYSKAILNIEFTDFVNRVQNVISGPVMIKFPDLEKKINPFKESYMVQMVQKALIEPPKKYKTRRKAGFYLSSYHVGAHDKINESYKRIIKWAKENNFEIENESIERYLIDSWTALDYDKYVTEIIIPIRNYNE